MTRTTRTLAAAALLTALCACSSAGAKTDIGLVDVQRIMANWPKFQNYQNQINNDAATVERSGKSSAEKARLRGALQQRFAQDQTELANDVKGAAQQVAGDKGLKMVFTRQFVGYGGIDITPEVEKVLKIEEKPSPAP
jgi:Skp family chaperone for outer membrane proteins